MIDLLDQQVVPKLQSLIAGERELGEVPTAHRRPIPKTRDYYYAASNRDRNFQLYWRTEVGVIP